MNRQSPNTPAPFRLSAGGVAAFTVAVGTLATPVRGGAGDPQVADLEALRTASAIPPSVRFRNGVRGAAQAGAFEAWSMRP